MIDGMKPQTVGRVLGVGLRVAGRMAGQRLAASGGDTAGGAAGVAPVQQATGARARQAGANAARVSSGVARGVGGFLRPFRRVGGIVFLEVTGAFFLLFVLVFGAMVWRLRGDYAHGPAHTKFLVAVGMTVVFLYLSLSSFWRANRR